AWPPPRYPFMRAHMVEEVSMAPTILSGCLVILAGLALPALADDGKDKAAELQAAIAACDKGASVPLDPGARAPAVHFSEFFAAARNLDKASVDAARTLAAQCKFAADGAPDQKRLKLEWLRTAYFAGLLGFDETAGAPKPERPDFASELRANAAIGSAEANYLIFHLYRDSTSGGAATSLSGVTREEALQGLTAAANAGHLEALMTLLRQYRDGPDFRRDPKAALRIADRVMDLPRQGPEPAGPYEARMRALARQAFGEVAVSTEGLPAELQARGFAIVKELFDREDPTATVPYATALRYGRGTARDAAAARTLLEMALANKHEAARVPLAAMLANGE